MANSALGQTGPQLKISTVTATGDGSTTTFALGVSPGAKTALDVFLDGVKQFQTEWELSGSNIVFDTAPASSVAIEIIVGAGHGVGTVSDGTITEPKLAAGATLKLGTYTGLSGASIDFTGIPAGTQYIRISIVAASMNGTDIPTIQIGDSGGIEDTGYVANYAFTPTAATISCGQVTTGILCGIGTAANLQNAVVELTLTDPATNLWTASNIAASGTSVQQALFGAAYKTLSGTLDRVRITGFSGGNTFDAGSINIAYK